MNDLINRQAAIELLLKWADGYSYIEIPTNAAVEQFKKLLSVQSEIIRCKDCKHKPHTSDEYDTIVGDGFEIIFPDYRCPCRCEDEYYNHMPDDNWYCGNAERRADDE